MILVTTDAPLRLGAASARRAVTTAFALNGFLFASWAVRIPDLSHQVGSSHAALGVALLCISLGALATMRLTGALAERLGPGLVTAVAAALVSLGVAAPGMALSIQELCLALAAFGAAGGILNVGMNSVGVELERLTGRSLLPRLHAAGSLGGLAGGLGGGLAATWLAPGPHLVTVAVGGLAAAGVMARPLIAADERPRTMARFSAPPDVEHSDAPSGPPGVGSTVVLLGVIAGCAAYGEGALADWGALYLVEGLGASSAVAACGYAVFCLAMASGRLVGHRLLDAFGATTVTAGGSLLAAVGMLVTTGASSVGTAMGGVALVGSGLANIFPLAIARAGALAGSRGVGLASMIGYSGLLLGPATIGFLASHAGLPLALTTVSVFAVAASGLAVRVRHDGSADGRLWWGLAGVTSWHRTWISPVAGVMAEAARRHAVSLEPLAPERASGSGRRPLRDPDAFQDLDALLGAPALRPRTG